MAVARKAAAEGIAGLEFLSGIPGTLGGAVPVALYVGRSAHTDRLGVTADGLRHGAFRLVSGPDHLVLLGQDADFALPPYLPRHFHRMVVAGLGLRVKLHGRPARSSGVLFAANHLSWADIPVLLRH